MGEFLWDTLNTHCSTRRSDEQIWATYLFVELVYAALGDLWTSLHERSNETGQLISKGLFPSKNQFCHIQIISILQIFLSSINWTSRPPGMESILDFLETQVKITPGERCQLLVTCIIWLVSGQYLAKKRGRNLLYHFTKCTSESIKASWAPAEWQNKFVKHKVLSDSEVTWDKIYLFNI